MADQTSFQAFGRSNLFWAGVLLIVALFGTALWLLLRTDYAPLYKEATEASQAEILAILSQHRVPYRINPQEGVIEVPTEHIAAARMYLAESGMPTRSGAGFELFDQADYGMSEFSQKINYQRALEGELARTVMGMSEVQYARVHLTFKKSGLFQGTEEQPKASVIVRLRSEGALSAQRVRGIQQLVASAVESMTPEGVVILNEQGQVLSSAESSAASPEHLQIATEVESALQTKAEQMLFSALGSRKAEVSVRVEMNFDKVKSVLEKPLSPSGKPVLKHEKKLSSSENSTGESSSRRTQNTAEVEYEVGKEHSEIEHQSGKIERINVGIVVGAALPAAHLEDLRGLLEAALGLDTKRGDQLVIVSLAEGGGFQEDSAQALAPPGAPTVHEPEATAVTAASEPENLSVSLRGVAAAALLLLAIMLFALWLRGRQARKIASASLPRLSSMERDQLLVDLRRWLQEGH